MTSMGTGWGSVGSLRIFFSMAVAVKTCVLCAHASMNAWVCGSGEGGNSAMVCIWPHLLALMFGRSQASFWLCRIWIPTCNVQSSSQTQILSFITEYCNFMMLNFIIQLYRMGHRINYGIGFQVSSKNSLSLGFLILKLIIITHGWHEN